MIYRRRIIGDIDEIIEIIVDSKVANCKTLSETFNDNSIKVLLMEIKDNNKIYWVEIPKYLKVKPPDWRDLAYDHEKAKDLISTCVTDNFQHFIFEPLNDTTLNKLQDDLSIALADLSSVIDLISVECTSNQEEANSLRVMVTFEHKNGERCSYITQTALDC
ncbi:MAG: hypothetical protein GY845_24125 [Planctomycetes bacterium]|nr:hypothetical protein [Planctomycetota bacterium]